jgi:hypothetical protein
MVSVWQVGDDKMLQTVVAVDARSAFQVPVGTSVWGCRGRCVACVLSPLFWYLLVDEALACWHGQYLPLGLM